MQIRPVGTELFHAGGRTDWQTDMIKLLIVFRNFPNAPEVDLKETQCERFEFIYLAQDREHWLLRMR
jgi:hypothetical protein